jgi:hypothetical protein
MAEAGADDRNEIWISQTKLSRIHPQLSGTFLSAMRDRDGGPRFRRMDRSHWVYLLSGGPGSVEEWLAERRGQRPPG